MLHCAHIACVVMPHCVGCRCAARHFSNALIETWVPTSSQRLTRRRSQACRCFESCLYGQTVTCLTHTLCACRWYTYRRTSYHHVCVLRLSHVVMAACVCVVTACRGPHTTALVQCSANSCAVFGQCLGIATYLDEALGRAQCDALVCRPAVQILAACVHSLTCKVTHWRCCDCEWFWTRPTTATRMVISKGRAIRTERFWSAKWKMRCGPQWVVSIIRSLPFRVLQTPIRQRAHTSYFFVLKSFETHLDDCRSRNDAVTSVSSITANTCNDPCRSSSQWINTTTHYTDNNDSMVSSTDEQRHRSKNRRWRALSDNDSAAKYSNDNPKHWRTQLLWCLQIDRHALNDTLRCVRNWVWPKSMPLTMSLYEGQTKRSTKVVELKYRCTKLFWFVWPFEVTIRTNVETIAVSKHLFSVVFKRQTRNRPAYSSK